MTSVGSVVQAPDAEAVPVTTAEYVVNALTGRGYTFGESGIPGVETLVFEGKKLEISVSIFCGDSYVTFVAGLPLIVADGLSGEVLKKINYLSTKIPIGGYELHTQSKKVLFKVGMPIPPKVPPDVLEKMLLLAVGSADSFSGTLLSIVEGSERQA